MPLGELQKEIYKREAKAKLPEQEPTVFRPERERDDFERPQREWEEEAPKEPRVFLTEKVKKYLMWGGVALGVIGITFFTIWTFQAFKSFDQSRVTLEIEAPKSIDSGQKVSFNVNYINKNKVALQETKLIIEYPKDSLPLGEEFSKPVYSFKKTINIGRIEAKETSKLELPTIVFGAPGDEKKIKVSLSYMPENFSSTFETDHSETFITQSSPLLIDWDFAGKAISGQEFEAKLNLINNSDNDFYNFRINASYPTGFDFESSTPAPSEGENLWSFEKIEANSEQEISIRGRISGQSEESKPFTAQIGMVREKDGIREFVLYDELKTPTKITSSPLFVTHTAINRVDDTVNPGEVLSYIIKYKNTTNVGIERVSITAKLIGEALDLTGLNIQGGSFDSFSDTISWRAGEVPALAVLSPDEEGELTFSVPIKSNLSNNKNFIVSSITTIDSNNIPSSLFGTDISGSHQLDFKINSNINLRQKGLHYEGAISNSGPIPPKVGSITTYNIVWQITNTSNDTEDIVIESYLPAYVSWQGKIQPSGTNIFYDDETRKITWNLGKLPAHTGNLLPLKQVTFQIGLLPSLSHLGSILDLIGEAQLSAKDSFTGKILKNFAPVVTTHLADDPFVNYQEGIVTD